MVIIIATAVSLKDTSSVPWNWLSISRVMACTSRPKTSNCVLPWVIRPDSEACR